ncbi:PHP domain-containing protein [Candidatus Saccharibacteria bacterium]|nr:PHP domain-containing protein [Candidatus Saccharibacteria bacterium]
MYESLHNHTLISDGSQTHLEVLASAQAAGFGVIAFTDHDVFPDTATQKQLHDYVGPVKWLLGIELSCGLPTELGGSDKGNLHVLGYFCDPDEPTLKAYLKNLSESRYVRMRRQLKQINELGFDLTEKQVLDVAGISAPGSFHVVKALLQLPTSAGLIEQLRQQMEVAAETDPEVAKRYSKMMASGPVQYPYTLFMQSSSFIPMPQDTQGNAMVDMDAAVKLIRGAGGVAMVAHWYFQEDKFSRSYLERALADGRLDGVETAVFNTQNGDADCTDAINYLVTLAETNNYAQVMGIDGHYERDFEIFKASGQAERSIGQTKALIKRFSPNLTESNY